MVAQKKSENRRDHERVSDPSIRLKIGAQVYHSINWSLGGILIDGYDGVLSPGSLLSITEIGLNRGVMTPVKVQARVIRADDEFSVLAVQMLEIDKSAYAILQKLLVKKMQVMRARPKPG
ncbi:MAG: PilZ domain-containing protein [Rhodospirillaceae bacterium]|nr:PilZ domain-containing protein [Rhodospirillaceae bacterium]MBL6930579.1 PilZ domain-containing protein [Rhodospirillales bacterium]MBL6940697.1 PilZ domain-containing protein [Rhodospirillales bacterium]